MDLEAMLEQTIAKADTSRSNYEERDENVNQSIFVSDIEVKQEDIDEQSLIDTYNKSTKRTKKKEETSENTEEHTEETTEEVDTTDYSLEDGTVHLMIPTRTLIKTMLQLAPLINLNSQRAISRGLSFEDVDDTHVKVTSPNELFHFSAILEVESKTKLDDIIFIEYLFLQKIQKFLPSKTLIYKKEDKFYIRLKTGDLELLNTYLLDADAKRLPSQFKVLDEVVANLEPTRTSRVLTSLGKLLKFESDAAHKQLHTEDGLTTFNSSFVKASATLGKVEDKTCMTNSPLTPKVIDYLLRACQLISTDTHIKFYKTDSPLTRYAICFDNYTMITNFPESKIDPMLKQVLNVETDLFTIDYPKLVFQLSYATSITYAKGVIEFVVNNNKLEGDIVLQNGNSSKIEIDVLDPITIPDGTKFKINTKSLLSSLTALDPSLETKVGFKDGMFYLVNDDITLGVITM